MQSADSNEPLANSQGAGWEVAVSSVALGLTSLVTQVIVLREFLCVFYGNELVIGILLSNWMLLTGIGSFVGRRLTRFTSSTACLIPLLVLLGTIPLLTVILLRILRNVVFPAGSMIGIIPIIGTSFVLLIPYCVLSGMSFTVLASLASGNGQNKVSGVYVREAIGSVVGGILFTLVLMLFLNAVQCLTAVMAIDLAASLALSRGRPNVSVFVWILCVALLVPALVIDIDRETKTFLFPDQQLLSSKDTPFGNLSVTEQSGQLNFYENNSLLSSTNDATSREEAVHYAMIQHPNPKSVLLISGGLSGATGEILKYNLNRVTYVEVNPDIIDLANRYTIRDGRIITVNEDAPHFLRVDRECYDVVLLNTPEPTTMQANRYCTTEFFARVKQRMNPGAILSIGLLPATDYQSNEARRINSTMFNTLKLSFSEVLIVPGLRSYFLASDSKLGISIGKLVDLRGLNNTYVNRYYLDDDDLSRRSALIRGSLIDDAPVNMDFEPVAYYHQIEHWLSYFRSGIWIVGILVAVLLLLVARRWNAISVGVFTGGFAASSIEVVLLLAFQVLYGYVYLVLGIIVTIFMAGMACGGHFGPRLFPSPTKGTYAVAQTAIAMLCFVLPLALLWMRNNQDIPVVVQSTIFLLTFVLAALVGLEFGVAARLRTGSVQAVASELYGVDLIGSALGALLVGIYLIPAFGFFATSVIAGLLSIMSAAILFAPRMGLVVRAA